MGYYDFNDHFWEPHQVCAQLPIDDSSQKSWLHNKLLQIRSFFIDTGDRLSERI